MRNPVVPEEVSAVASQLAEPRPMRRGSVSERYVKCNKAGCACADDTDARHGPYYSVSRVVKGRTKSRWLDAEQARQVREQVATGRKFRELVDAYWQACEQWADAQLESSEAPRKRRPKKGLQNGVRDRNRHRDRSAPRHGVIDEWDFEAIETAARRMAMRVAARVVEQRLNADTSDHAGPMLPCACGQSARYAGRHSKNFASVLGPLRLERAYYHCELCEAGFCPRDRALGLQGGSLSPGVLRMAGLVGAMVSFEEGHELLHELAGVDVPTKQSSARPRRWGVSSPRTRSSWSSRRSQTNHWRQRCTLGWMVQVCPCAKRSW